MKRLILCAVVVFCCVGQVNGAIQATFVTDGIGLRPTGGGDTEFNSGSASIFVDPAETKWIAWTSDILTPDVTDPLDPWLGAIGIGNVDDYARVTVTNPLNVAETIYMGKKR